MLSDRFELLLEKWTLGLPLGESFRHGESAVVTKVRSVPQIVPHGLSHFDPLPPSVKALRHHLDSWVSVAQQATDGSHAETKIPLLHLKENP